MAAFDNDSDESLMALIRQRNHQAFAALVRRHSERFFAFAFRMTGRHGEAEDMVQEAFLKIWDRPDAWQADRGAKFTTWFYRVLSNQNIDRLRRGQKMTGDDSVLPFIADSRPGPEDDTADREGRQRLERAIAALPERQRTALTLCFHEGLSNADAAVAMNVRLKALESLLMRAKAGLRLAMNDAPADDADKKGGKYATR